MTKRYYAGIGARKTPAEIMLKMTELAKEYAKQGLILRSGGADGADSAFELGADKKEIWLPYLGFNGHKSRLLPHTDAFAIAAKYHPHWSSLDHPVRCMHARNVHQVLGADLKTPVEFVCCWTADGKASGGTGQAMRIAKAYKIPINNLWSAQ